MTVRIMLDPGHAGSYFNASPVVSGYYESAQMWLLTQKLKSALEDYGFEVGLTRYSIHDDPELTERGRRAKGYDLFISMHSNAAANENANAPWLIHYSSDSKTYLDEKSLEAARVLGPVISEVMGVTEPFYYTKGVDFDRDGNGYLDDEYYGVLFGAKSVGVPGIIIEHSFHTNRRAAEWLLKDENLDKLAEAEALAIAQYYGMEEKGMTESEKKAFEALEKNVKTLEARLKEVTKRFDKVEECPSYGRKVVRKLIDAGILKGKDGGRLDLSEDTIRILVYLDRAGVFNK